MQALTKVIFVACGTSYHAAIVGKFLIEQLARIPVEVDLASEFRYRDPIIDDDAPGDRGQPVGRDGRHAGGAQGGEGARRARRSRICNVRRQRHPARGRRAFYTHAGPEIGVASTKAFTTQLAALFLLAIYLGRRAARSPTSRRQAHLQALSRSRR